MSYKYGSYGYIAHKDLRDAKLLYSVGSYDACAVHAEQAVEKLLKEVINTDLSITADPSILKTHKIRKLIKVLATKYPELAKYSYLGARLSDVYFDTRYPGIDYEECDQQEAKELLSGAEEVFAIIEGSVTAVKPMSLD